MAPEGVTDADMDTVGGTKMGNCLFSECPFWDRGCCMVSVDECPMEIPEEDD